jgi:hypothetical protein
MVWHGHGVSTRLREWMQGVLHQNRDLLLFDSTEQNSTSNVSGCWTVHRRPWPILCYRTSPLYIVCLHTLIVLLRRPWSLPEKLNILRRQCQFLVLHTESITERHADPARIIYYSQSHANIFQLILQFDVWLILLFLKYDLVVMERHVAHSRSVFLSIF